MRGNYRIVFEESDSLLVKQLFRKIEQPLKKLENFFNGDAGRVVTIIITKSEEEYKRRTRGVLPEWSQAAAFTNQGLVILRLVEAREVRESPQILLHELTHIFLADYYPLGRIPVWLNEGMAEYFSGKTLDLQSRVRLANALAAKKIVDLRNIDSLHSFKRFQAQLAYTEALSAVDYFVGRYGLAGLKSLLNNLAQYRSYQTAFKKTTGHDFIDFELNWYQELVNRYRWLIVLNIDNLIWITMALLALAAIWAIHRRNRRRLKEWEEDDADNSIDSDKWGEE